ncbi:MAG: tyrosine--tRNA ligase [Ferruginibacter sp.]|nr:tyrosine--tRNA ligase [Ferruginibacter sp.]
MNLIKELSWRGMIQDIMPGTEAHLLKEITTAYVGFDPTADSLHIGSLVPILLLVHLQRCGHKPIALVGGATGMVGDPSGKSEERNLLSEDTLHHNVSAVKAQLEKFLQFDGDLPNAAEMANNYDWFKEITFLDFIRDTGKHITVNYMMAKDSVKKRLEGENGMSFTEFTYQLVQGYDYYWLYKNKNCKLQMGGSDQWGNIVTGTELIRKKIPGSEAFAFTCPLIKKADGGKFGKTEKGNIWLDPAKTSPFHFYQFWLNATDSDAESWVKIFTFLPESEVERLLEKHRLNASGRLLQKRLAEEVTLFVHGREELDKAIETTVKLFANQTAPATSLSEADLESIEGIVKIDYPAAAFNDGIDFISFSADTSTNIFPSKGEAKKMIQNGGVSINRIKVENLQLRLDPSMLLHGKYLLVQKGKKNYYLVVIV